MTPTEVRKLGRILTRERLWPMNGTISDWRIAQTIAEPLGVTSMAVEHWLAGRRQINGSAAILLRLLAK